MDVRLVVEKLPHCVRRPAIRRFRGEKIHTCTPRCRGSSTVGHRCGARRSSVREKTCRSTSYRLSGSCSHPARTPLSRRRRSYRPIPSVAPVSALRDTGLLHALLGLPDDAALLGHPPGRRVLGGLRDRADSARSRHHPSARKDVATRFRQDKAGGSVCESTGASGREAHVRPGRSPSAR